MQRLLLAYDGSAPSKQATARAGSFARQLGARVTVLIVGGLVESGYGTVVPVVDAEEYERVLAEGVDDLRRMGVEAQGRLVWGGAGEKIVEAAREEAADLIVMGHRGHGGLKSLLLGSVAKHVIDHAACSVLVVR